MELDWSDGRYEHTAAQLGVAAERALHVAAIREGDRVLDVGCGTGNASLLAARQTRVVHGVDPASRLLAVARQRADEEGADVEFSRGTAADPGVDPASFDVAIAVFSIIFAPDPAAAVAGVLRALRPGGRMVVTTWRSEGPINAAAMLLFRTMVGESGPLPKSPWAEPESLHELFEAHDTRVQIAEETIVFCAASASEWVETQEAHHPFWRAARKTLANRPSDYDRVRQQSIELLRDASECRDSFRTTSRYLIAHAKLPVA